MRSTPMVYFLLIFFLLGGSATAQESSMPSPVKISPPLRGKEEVRISIDLKDASIKDVLKILSQQAGLNFVASEEIEDKRLTLYLDQVTVSDALANIVTANNLEVVQVEGSDIFIVRPKGMREEELLLTKVYKLKYARVSTSALEIGASNVTLEAGTRKAPSGLTGTSTGGTVSGAAGGEKASKVLRGLDLVIEKLLTEKGSLVTDPRTNSLLITDVPSQFKMIDSAIAKLDRPVPQVLIEAEILETSASLAKELGAQWGSAADATILGATAASTITHFPFGIGKTEDVEAPTSGAVGNLRLGSIDASSLSVVLNLLHSNTDTKILARPKVLVLDNEGAVIDLTSSTAIASLTVQQAAEGLATQTTQAERTQTGVSLRVTPQVNDDDYVTLFVEPAVVSAAASKFFSQFVDPQTRAARTTVMVKSGNTLVIGGLINTEETTIVRKVPLLGDIPILGLAFRKKQADQIDKEVIVFLTPRIIRAAETPFPEELLEKEEPVTVVLPMEEEREVAPPTTKEEEIERILEELSSRPQ